MIITTSGNTSIFYPYRCDPITPAFGLFSSETWSRHHHPENPAGVGYPELYEIVEGVAHFLLQEKTLEHIALVKAAKSDIVLIPPGYGHITINPSDEETLVMANLVSTAFESEYAFYEIMHGAAWYELVGNILVRNPHYPDVPPVQEIKCQTSPLNVFGDAVSLYDYVGNAEIAGLLNHPEKYPAVFSQSLF